MTCAFITTLPLTFAVLTFLRLNFFTIRNYSTKYDYFVNPSNVRKENFSSLFLFFLTVTSALFYLVARVGINFSSLHPNNNLAILMLLSTILLVYMFGKGKSSPIFGPIASIFSLSGLLLFCADNIMQFYLIIEVLAYLNLLFIALYSTLKPKKSQSYILALVVSFILNFIASIVFFLFILSVLWHSGVFSFSHIILHAPEGVVSLLTLLILLKIGVGPWAVGNITSYQGYALSYLAVYTAVSVSMVTPSLLLVSDFNVNQYITVFSVSCAIFFISKTLHSVTNLKSLFAYSTVIVYIYILLVVSL